MEEQKQDTIRRAVRESYASVATTGAALHLKPSEESCCGDTTADKAALVLGYGEEEVRAVPEGANMGLGCGNPTAIASLQPGETVLDLGSGGGFDCFLASVKVGEGGRVIGVDMTPEMIGKARGNTEAYRERTGLSNVEFRLGEIEHLPLADASADAVISNCVINLSPDKPQVWREIARVLRPGGRVAVSDLALLQPLPAKVRGMLEALVGCIAGAVTIAETKTLVADAGLTDIVVEPKQAYVEAMTEWNDPLYQKIIEQLPAGSRASDYIVSVNVTATN